MVYTAHQGRFIGENGWFGDGMDDGTQHEDTL